MSSFEEISFPSYSPPSLSSGVKPKYNNMNNQNEMNVSRIGFNPEYNDFSGTTASSIISVGGNKGLRPTQQRWIPNYKGPGAPLVPQQQESQSQQASSSSILFGSSASGLNSNNFSNNRHTTLLGGQHDPMDDGNDLSLYLQHFPSFIADQSDVTILGADTGSSFNFGSDLNPHLAPALISSASTGNALTAVDYLNSSNNINNSSLSPLVPVAAVRSTDYSNNNNNNSRHSLLLPNGSNYLNNNSASFNSNSINKPSFNSANDVSLARVKSARLTDEELAAFFILENDQAFSSTLPTSAAAAAATAAATTTTGTAAGLSNDIQRIPTTEMLFEDGGIAAGFSNISLDNFDLFDTADPLPALYPTNDYYDDCDQLTLTISPNRYSKASGHQTAPAFMNSNTNNLDTDGAVMDGYASETCFNSRSAKNNFNSAVAAAAATATTSKSTKRRTVTLKGASKRTHTKRQPERSEFSSQQEYEQELENWRRNREINNESVKRSREKLNRELNEKKAQLKAQQSVNAQLARKVDAARHRLQVLERASSRTDGSAAGGGSGRFPVVALSTTERSMLREVLLDRLKKVENGDELLMEDVDNEEVD